MAEIVICLAKDAAEALSQFAKINITRSSENILSQSSVNPLGHLQLKAAETFGQILFVLCKAKYESI